MPGVLTLSHSPKMESINQNVAISQQIYVCTYHSYAELLLWEKIHGRSLSSRSLYFCSDFLWVEICAAFEWKNTFFFDELIFQPKQSQLTAFQTWLLDTFYFCYYISLRRVSIFNKQRAFFLLESQSNTTGADPIQWGNHRRMVQALTAFMS